jgi:hypothetical protein
MKKYLILLPLVALLTKADAQQGQPDQAAMMKKWMEYMTPGDMHKMLASFNGKWEGEVTMWMDPSAPPTKSKTTATNTMIVGGRYQEATHSGNFGGMPFEGKSIIGYDNIKKVFVSSWVDNMGTGIMVLEGPYDPKTKTITMRGKMTDPMSGTETQVREVFRIVDDKHQVMEMYNTYADGKEMKSMEIKYSRM